MSHGKFYYWQRVIREEALIKAGTLAVTGQTQFIEVKPSKAEFKSNNQGTVPYSVQMEMKSKF